eukprot:g12329.t2
MERWCADGAGRGSTPSRSTTPHGTNATLAGASLVLPLLGQRRKRGFASSRSDDPCGDPTEALLDQVKKCRVSSTPGELRLKRDLSECDSLRHQGVARFDKAVGNPLKCQLTFLRSIGATTAVVAAAAAVGPGDAGAGGVAPANDVSTRVPTTFEIIVPKFYPHDPPLVYAERSFSRTCPFVREDGLLVLPFLSTGAWSSVSTMSFVAEALLQGLQKFAAGQPQPWGPVEASGRDHYSRRDEDTPAPVAFAAHAAATSEPIEITPHVADNGAGGGVTSRYWGEASRDSNSSSSSTGFYPGVERQQYGDSEGGAPQSMAVVDLL